MRRSPAKTSPRAGGFRDPTSSTLAWIYFASRNVFMNCCAEWIWGNGTESDVTTGIRKRLGEQREERLLSKLMVCAPLSLIGAYAAPAMP